LFGTAGLLTGIHPLHAVGERLVCDEVVASPAGVDDDGMRPREQREGEQAGDCRKEASCSRHDFLYDSSNPVEVDV
jgi:hypothetical protein